MLKNVRVLRESDHPAETIEAKRKEMIRVTGIVNISDVKGGKLNYYAAAPADSRHGFSGSGLPFADPEQAFYGTPNVGSVKLTSANAFQIDVEVPNSYYVGMGSVRVPPSLHLWCMSSSGKHREETIKLSEGIPFRSLTYPALPTRPRDGPLFYKGDQVQVRSQEMILRDSAYPSLRAIRNGYDMPSNFWGLKPPF